VTDFPAIVAAHQERVFHTALRILANREEARDVTQEAFLELHRHAAALREDKVGAWLARVVTNRSLDRVRRRKRLAFVPLPASAPGDEAGPAAVSERAEEGRRVRAALAELPRRQREVLTARVLEQHSFVEIARLLAISEGAAKVHFRRGLAALRRRLIPDEESR